LATTGKDGFGTSPSRSLNARLFMVPEIVNVLTSTITFIDLVSDEFEPEQVIENE
jgi:hypothetical protein